MRQGSIDAEIGWFAGRHHVRRRPAGTEVADAALSTVNSQRAQYGALQSRFSSAISNLQSTTENLSVAQPHRRYRLRSGNGQPDPRPDPATSRYRHAGASKFAA
jgi:hypothetical protein